jgi:peptidoglycan/xylan/chitin deacetylase (PgdA/CDA1 family)
MQLRPSLVFEVIAALLTAYFFFSLSETAGRKNIQPALRPDSALTRTRIDTLAGREQPSQVPPLSSTPVEPTVIDHGPRNEKIIALTFDACSTHDPSNYDERISEVLIRTQTPATLFLGGKWMTEESEQTKQLAANPLFELGNHTYSHPHLRNISDERIREELQSTQSVMESLIGKRASLFRPPYGEYDDRVVRIAASIGLRTVQFDLASGDPDPAISKDRLVHYVSSMARSGSIIVMHINRRGWHTAEALPEIISRLRQRGFIFKTVSDMLDHPAESGHGNINEHP